MRHGGPCWTYNVVQSFVNAENVSIAHLLYEQRLIEHTNSPDTLPNIGGQAFVVTDPNPPMVSQDVFLLLKTLAKTPIDFPFVPAIPLVLLSYLVEWYSLLQHQYLPWLPKLRGDLAQLQPGLFTIASAHIIGDDSRARKSPEQGGLGYSPPLTTLEGMCKEVRAWNEAQGAKTTSL